MTAGSSRFLVIGATTLARRVCAALMDRGHTVDHLLAPDDAELRASLQREVAGIAILLHQDDVGLRYALAAAHFAPGVPIVAAIFDATMSEQLHRLLPSCIVTSPAELAAPMLVAACLGDGAALFPTARGRAEVVAVDTAGVTHRAWRRSFAERMRALRGRIAGQLRPHDAGSRILYLGLGGATLALLCDFIWLVGVGTPWPEAFQEAAQVAATVGPEGRHGEAYGVFAGLAMLLSVLFTGMFTAGLVDMLLGPRLIGLFGSRALPRAGHVVVVGLGQVGLRLCRHLQALGIPVVGVERDGDARWVEVARNLGIPVVIGNGVDRAVLERVRISHAVALAAVGSADLDNISVAVSARGVAPEARIVLRAGEHELISETASLLPLGETRDVTRLSSAYVVARLLGVDADHVLLDGNRVLLLASGAASEWKTSRPHGCSHVAPS
ncbi:MAG TPA: NAD-binding protein [Nocardioides sp.]|nr:NAD-binding protein [Nocardioides sp.]